MRLLDLSLTSTFRIMAIISFRSIPGSKGQRDVFFLGLLSACCKTVREHKGPGKKPFEGPPCVYAVAFLRLGFGWAAAVSVTWDAHGSLLCFAATTFLTWEPSVRSLCLGRRATWGHSTCSMGTGPLCYDSLRNRSVHGYLYSTCHE